MWSTIWKILVGIGVVTAIIVSIWELDGHWATCEMVAQLEKDTVKTMKSTQMYTDLKVYDFALKAIERDIQDECPTNATPKCQRYENDRQALQKNKTYIMNQLTNSKTLDN
jgi:hypothetical protein